MTLQPTYVSLFSSAGLGCFGFKSAGFNCLATAELISRRLDVQKANNVCAVESGYILGDLTDESIVKSLVQEVQAQLNGDELTALIATPPCQGMSVANHKKKNELPRNSLVITSLEIIRTLSPKFFVLENVRSFLTSTCLDSDGTQKAIAEAIDRNLGHLYNIHSKVVNLKEIGSPSSRTRTLVIGVRRDIHDVTPLDVVPAAKEAPTLRQLIGDLPELTEFGEIWRDDIFHHFRRYDERMLPWISATAEGRSAFENEDPTLRPHQIIDGKIVPNQAKNGDKYRRNYWDKVAPCIHTRNDILASQSTVHPKDNRVFSIREICRMMGVPDSFKWSSYDTEQLNALPIEEKREFLKSHEINIRQCLGEGVPTPVFESIARSIRHFDRPSQVKAGRPPKRKEVLNDSKIVNFLRASESGNPRKSELAAYYTRQDIVFSLVATAPEFRKSRRLHILEPSVGSGAFLPHVLQKYAGKQIELDVVDIDPYALEQTRKMLSSLDIDYSKVNINFIESDFLSFQPAKKYDLVIGNPPFGSISDKDAGKSSQHGLKDLYARFLEKALEWADHLCLVIPKSFLGGPEFTRLRNTISSNHHVVSIEDYGESAFESIKIETIGLTVSPKLEASNQHETRVMSLPLKSQDRKPQNYLLDSKFPSWVIYRSPFFDKIANQLELNFFSSFRDRQLTKSRIAQEGPVRVIKARSIGKGEILPIMSGYCEELDVPKSFHRKVSGKQVLVAPNLSYYTRAAILPVDAFPDGSAAALIPSENSSTELNEDEVRYYSSADFFYFYRIARNYSVRSLNIDSISVFYWGVPKKGYRPVLSIASFDPKSKNLFEDPELLVHRQNRSIPDSVEV
ncbi:DNA cytosine methyltransferase [Neomicrococcus aestuarii]|uniref:DNA (cytosine-5-)-methyltransferase n=1 Tax=Neomicrococcus aestuarii TaxID=556325 RepID=A0A1L2ZPW0_9MICC|nr:DNA cytosine methyltransferase [Neomicrococcus aestuarii]APF41226.1 hypothetical protein BHE16_09750 [Neomicrococcus aestuarii]